MIGGGPAGFYAAYCLARAARSVAVFEEHQEIGSPVHCTGLLAIEAFSRFTLPQDSILATMRRAPGFTLQVGTSFPLHRMKTRRWCWTGRRLIVGLRIKPLRPAWTSS